MKVTKERKADALETLRDILKEGDTVYSIGERSASNMSARYSAVVWTPHGVLHPTWAVAVATGYSLVERDGRYWVRVRGCGFNRWQAVVAAVAAALGYENLRAEVL